MIPQLSQLPENCISVALATASFVLASELTSVLRLRLWFLTKPHVTVQLVLLTNTAVLPPNRNNVTRSRASAYVRLCEDENTADELGDQNQ